MHTKYWIAAAAALVATGTAYWMAAAPAIGPLPDVAPFAARADRPRLSPHESVTATVDAARVVIVYGRPYMRGRTIFGGLVPWGRVWCPGADEATTLESDHDLEIGSIRVPAGPHTIWILPDPVRWTLIISREPSGFHTQYDASADLGRVHLDRRELADAVEQLTFAIQPAAGGGTITMAWETTEVSVPFRVVR